MNKAPLTAESARSLSAANSGNRISRLWADHQGCIERAAELGKYECRMVLTGITDHSTYAQVAARAIALGFIALVREEGSDGPTRPGYTYIQLNWGDPR